jgi:cytosine deaminase|tara:strand:- start:82 stop:1308 length:1227 start_codon:yes stop_codon:yes gene_type:complete
MVYDIIIRNAKLRSGEIVEVAIADGKYAEIGANIKGDGAQELDADGNLVTESFVIGQLHLDKVLTGDWMVRSAREQYFDGGMGGAMTAIEFAAEVKRRYEEDEILARIDKVMEYAILAGATHIRAFIDVDSKAELKGMKAALRAREKWRHQLDLQVIAFPQDGLPREPGAEELLYESMELGADLIGGIPWIEFTDADARRHVDIAFEIAEKYDKDVTMLLDDAGDPELRTSEYAATEAVRRNWIGRVVGCHMRASALYSEVYHRKWVELLKRADMGIVTNPHTGPLHIRVKDLAREGIVIGLGGESVNDAYYPYGHCSMLEAAFVSSHTLWAMDSGDQELLYDMITVNPAKLLRLPEHKIAVGNEANLVVLHHESLREAYAHHSDPRYVIYKGHLTAESQFTRTLHDV